MKLRIYVPTPEDRGAAQAFDELKAALAPDLPDPDKLIPKLMRREATIMYCFVYTVEVDNDTAYHLINSVSVKELNVAVQRIE